MAMRELVVSWVPAVTWLCIRSFPQPRPGRCCCSLYNCVVGVLAGGSEGTGCAYSFQVRVQGSQGTEVTVTYTSPQHKVLPRCALVYLAFLLGACLCF
jgi:hypothetical protein